jgi:16S rRNA (uracil1498-N3)-methyltransferase
MAVGMAKVRYFFCEAVKPVDKSVRISGSEFHHLSQVSRVRRGDRIYLLDGRGGTYDAMVNRIGSRVADVEILTYEKSDPPPAIDMALALIQSRRFDTAVEKCVELGVRSIVPFVSERCMRRSPGSKATRMRERFNQKIIAACKQSGQPWLPRISAVLSFDSLLERLSRYSALYLADPQGDAGAKRIGTGYESGVLGIVGPEGGISPKERKALFKRGVVPLSLGPFRLRSETAAICLLFRLHGMTEAGSL